MEVDAKSHVCPVCGYEFPTRSNVNRVIAILLVLLFLLILFFSL